ncbi:MAG: hypothetical protein H7A35_14945 [Planctomycetales bacterium]|nr:hypothetical protein [bacterium]UNM08128.1 MAG: hypothetical protein H7A35_14945 [Planctomycetales bacterium]
MTQSLISLFTGWSRSARYPAFAWLCILVLPISLNILAGMLEEFRDSLGEYYGLFSLYMMFQFSLGLATLFLGTMLVTSISRSELVEQLRLTLVSPFQLLLATMRHLFSLLWPPSLAFFIGVTIWMFATSQQGMLLRVVGIGQLLVFVLLLACTQLITLLVITLGIERNIFGYVLAAIPVQFALTLGVVFLLVAHILAPWQLVLLSLGLVVAMGAASTYNLNRLWPPQQAGRRIFR